jgi:type II secretory pathway pseudopilin PulG
MQQSNSEAGFTLLESVVAFTILTLILLTSFETFGDGTKRINDANASVLRQNKLQNAMAQLEAGIPKDEIDKDVTVIFRLLPSEEIDWSTKLPIHATLTLNDGSGQSSLETILLRDRGSLP